MNCIDEKTAAAYCEARGARLPTEAEWALAAQSAGADGKSLLELLPSGVDDTRWEWTSDGPHGGGAQPPARWHGTNVRSHTLGFRCAEGSR
jgi:formylglycine-generating enzyme required for sulfatase activity